MPSGIYKRTTNKGWFKKGVKAPKKLQQARWKGRWGSGKKSNWSIDIDTLAKSIP